MSPVPTTQSTWTAASRAAVRIVTAPYQTPRASAGRLVRSRLARSHSQSRTATNRVPVIRWAQ
jgi:hypothetical protein